MILWISVYKIWVINEFEKIKNAEKYINYDLEAGKFCDKDRDVEMCANIINVS